MSLPRTREMLAEPGMAPLPELRRRIGAKLSDEEFLLRATMPANLVDAMQAAGPAPRHYDPATTAGDGADPQAARAPRPRRVIVEKAGFRLALRRSAPAADETTARTMNRTRNARRDAERR